MSDNFKNRLASRELLYGTMISLPCPAVAEALAGAGFDWFFIDGEHGPLGTTEIVSILQAVSHKGACVVRVPEAAEVPIKKMLDIGAHGIIVPQVNTAQQAQDVVRWAKYAPLGARGVGLARAQGYGATFAEYVASANDEIAVIVQAEHILAVENLDEILGVQGIDAIQLGPYDLSASMGKIGQVTDAEVVAAIDRICSACASAGIPVGSFGVSTEAVECDVKRGATLLCVGTDALFLGQAGSAALANLKQVKSQA